MSELALYEHAKEAIAAAVNIDEVTRLHSAAQQARAYARIAKDKKLQADATELVARAERKLGIMIRRVKDDGLLSKGGRPSENSNLTEETGDQEEPVFDNTPFTLADIGVDKKLSSRAQRAADMSDSSFEAAVQDKRERILAAAAPAVSVRKIRVIKSAKPAPTPALEPRRFHQFAFSVLAMSLKSQTVSSEIVHFFAREAGIVSGLGDEMEFSPEAEKAMGNLAEVALRAAEVSEPVLAGVSPEASASSADESDGGIASDPGAAAFLERAQLREAYDGEVALLLPQKGKLTRQTAEAAMRAGYAAEVPLLIMADDLGHPKGTLAGWAHKLGITSIARMHANQQRFGDEA